MPCRGDMAEKEHNIMADETLEPTEPQDATLPDTGVEEQGNDSGQKPPWSEEDFDAEKAWKLVQNLRDERKSLKTERDELAQAAKAAEDAKLTEQERMQRDLEAAQKQLEEINLQKAWAEARAAHPQLSDDDFDLLGASTPEQVSEKAAKLAARIASQAPANPKLNSNPLRGTPQGGVDPSASTKHDWLRDALNSK